MLDQNFDGLVEHFEQKIYGTLKGQIRLQLLKNELQHYLQQRSLKSGAKESLKILDIAGGLGQLSIWLASMGHEVTYVDISEQMLSKAQQNAKETGVYDNIQWIHAPFQQLVQPDDNITSSAHLPRGPFDLILAHAVLEWLADPYQGLQAILSLLSPETALSLAFYNRQAIILHNVLRGNFRKVLSDDFRGEAGGLTPLNPLNPADIRSFIHNHHLNIKREMGLRSFYDYLPRPVKEKISSEDILQMEQKLAHQQPYTDMARYVHFFISR